MEPRTQNMMVRCRCQTARVTVQVGPGGYLLGTEQNAWVQAAISRSLIVERLPGGWNRTEHFVCLSCLAPFKVDAIKGRKSSHKCDARCLASTSGKCECACGGKNHGASYA